MDYVIINSSREYILFKNNKDQFYGGVTRDRSIQKNKSVLFTHYITLHLDDYDFNINYNIIYKIVEFIISELGEFFEIKYRKSYHMSDHKIKISQIRYIYYFKITNNQLLLKLI